MKLFHVRKFFYWNTLTLLFLHEFCLIYINIISIQHILHTAVEYNEVELRLESIKRSPPLFFYYNMQKYDCSGSYYAESSLEVNYPSLKDQLSKTGKSIQTRSRHPHRAAIVMREEQAIKRDVKSAGSITRLLSY